jgi:large subunit ribosomal protein L27
MAHTKSQGKTNQKSNRPGQRRGIKKFGDQKIEVGQIIVRQVGSKVRGGLGTKTGKDFTIYAMRPGIVKFFKKLGKKFVSVVKAKPSLKKTKVVKTKPVAVKKTIKKSVK